MSKTRLNHLQSVVVADLTKRAEELFAVYEKTIAKDDLLAWQELSRYMSGVVHGPRPSDDTIAKALNIMEQAPWELVETCRRLAIAQGQLPDEDQNDTND